MLTKEECSLLLALRCHNCKYQFTCNSCLINKKLEQLINEHFDNPPLKFEEIKEGMWVWDDYCNHYSKIICTYVGCLGTICVIFSDGTESVFKENRFYRKQVE